MASSTGTARRSCCALTQWRAAAGEHWLLAGPSGSGKSTLLHILAGLTTPIAGEVSSRASTSAKLAGSARDRWRGRTVGLVPQRLHLVGALNVRDNLRLAQYLAGLPDEPERVRELLEAVQDRGSRAALSARAVAGPGAAGRDRPRRRQSSGAVARRRADGESRRRARGGGARAPARAGDRGQRDAGRRVARRARAAAAAAHARAAGAAAGGGMSATSAGEGDLVNVLRLALAYARRRPLATLLNVLLLAVGVATITLVILLSARARTAARPRGRRHRPRRRRQGKPAAARARRRLPRRRSAGKHSARGSGIAARESAGARSDSARARRQLPWLPHRRHRTRVRRALPGDAGGGSPVVRSARRRAGQRRRPRDRACGGRDFAGSHGLAEGGGMHEDARYTVVGVLAPTGIGDRPARADRHRSVWKVHEHHHDDSDESGRQRPEPPAARLACNAR